VLTIRRLDISDARLLIAGAADKAREIGVPMCIAITDESGQLVVLYQTPFVLPHSFEGVARQVQPSAFIVAGKHRPGGDDNRRDIDPRGSHQHARGNLVAVGKKDQPVQLMGLGHRLDHIGDEFTGRQGVVHAGMAHRNAVADARDAEKERIAAARMDPFLDKPLQVTHADVAGDDVGKARGNSDERLVHLCLWNAGSIQQGPVRNTLQPLLDFRASHRKYTPFSFVVS